MKFTVATKDLSIALRNVEPAIAKRPALAVLGGVRVETSESGLQLQTTDLDLTIDAHVAARVEATGVAVISAKQLITAARATKQPHLTITSDADKVHISDGRMNLSMTTLRSEDWPDRRSPKELTKVATAGGDELVRAISRVARCASTDQGRPILTGVQFNIDPGSRTLELVATDSYRLGVTVVRLQSVNGDYTEHPILAAGHLKAMGRKIPGGSPEVSIYAGYPGGHPSPVVEFRFHATTWTMRPIEGAFPHWQRIMPDRNQGGSFEFDAKELSIAVADAAGIRSDSSIPVRLKLGPTCSIRMVDGQVGELSQPLGQAIYSPNGTGPMEIAFNPAFLKDALAFVDTDRAVLKVTDPCKPALFLGVDEQCVVMPVRTS